MSPTSSLDLSVIAERSFVRVRPHGEVDLANRDLLDEQLTELWDSGWTHVVLDMGEVSFLDSSGLHVLVLHHRRAAGDERRFSVTDGSPAVARVLALTGLDRVLDCAPVRAA